MTNDINKIKEIRNTRLEICNSCEFFVKDTTACKRCGCIMSLKVNFVETKCPIGKW